jgi:hypothetical protein
MKNILKFKENGSFKIMMFSDLQDKLPVDTDTIRLLCRLLDEEKPDFVISAGDQCEGGITSESYFRDYVRCITEPMESREIYWSHVFGNHDDEYSPECDKFRQQLIYEEFPHCLSEAGPRDIGGIGNYVLPVMANGSDDVVFNIWALDSNRYLSDNSWNDDGWLLPENSIGTNGYDVVKFPQIMYYWNTSVEMEKQAGHKIPGLMFMHIALPEHRLVAMNPKETGMDGEVNEEICGSAINSGLFSAVLQRGDVKGIFAGHDHINDFAGTYCGVMLGCDASIGYGNYGFDTGDKKERNRLRGARFFEIDENSPSFFKTYMRYGNDYDIIYSNSN